MTTDDHRAHHRINLAMDIPFMGFHAGRMATFEYDLADLSSTGVQIKVRGGQDVLPLGKGDLIDLLVCLKSNEGILFDRGKVKWTDERDTSGAMVCGLQLEASSPGTQDSSGEPLGRRIFLSLESSNVAFQEPGFESAEDAFRVVLEEAAQVKEKMVRELDLAIAELHGPEGEKVEYLGRLCVRLGADISLLRSYGASLAAGPAPEGPTLGYEELCALLKPGSSRLGPILAEFIGKGESFSKKITSFSLALLACHNALVLLKMGYLAYVYQNPENF